MHVLHSVVVCRHVHLINLETFKTVLVIFWDRGEGRKSVGKSTGITFNPLWTSGGVL